MICESLGTREGEPKDDQGLLRLIRPFGLYDLSETKKSSLPAHEQDDEMKSSIELLEPMQWHRIYEHVCL